VCTLPVGPAPRTTEKAAQMKMTRMVTLRIDVMYSNQPKYLLGRQKRIVIIAR
jgi:hypothetical protein